MLLHIFRLEAKASAEAAGDKRIGTAEPQKLSGVEDIIGRASAVAERMPVMPQTALLRYELSAASES
jgi:hypothetical protein